MSEKSKYLEEIKKINKKIDQVIKGQKLIAKRINKLVVFLDRLCTSCLEETDKQMVRKYIE